MLTLRRKAFASVLVALLIIVTFFNLRPLSTERFHSFVGGLHDAAEGSSGEPPSKHSSPLTEKPLPEDEAKPIATPSTHVAVASTSSEVVPVETSTALPDKIIVVAKLRWEDTDWVTNNFPDWQHAIYTVDDPTATLHTPQNKGREASAYLTYIIENYSDLPTTIVFLHSHQTHDHGSRSVPFPQPMKRTGDLDVDADNVASVKKLNLDHVQKSGFTNLRCVLNPGCPAELLPFRPEEELDPLRPQERAMLTAWPALFQNNDIPEVIAAPCCAQFAVSKEQVLKRTEEEYRRFLTWLLETELNDFTSGRIFEYLWHVIFGRDAVHCPEQRTCYREQYGIEIGMEGGSPTFGASFANGTRVARPGG